MSVGRAAFDQKAHLTDDRDRGGRSGSARRREAHERPAPVSTHATRDILNMIGVRVCEVPREEDGERGESCL